MSNPKPDFLKSLINKTINPNAYGADTLPFMPTSGRYATPDFFANLSIHQFVIQEEKESYLICNTLYSNSNREIAVAKPFIFLPSWYDGRSLGDARYIKTNENTRVGYLLSDHYITETQQITPDYLAGEIITALNVRVYEYQADLLDTKIKLLDENNHNIRFIDLNLAGRCWAMVYDEF